MDRKPIGFTLLELITVIIIVGILAVLGLNQYTTIVERGRAGEARSSIGLMRKLSNEYYLKNGTFASVSATDIGIGSTGLPSACGFGYYFRYWVDSTTHMPSYIVIGGTRCTSGGKTPNGPSAYNIYATCTEASGACVGAISCNTADWSAVCGY